MSAGQSIHISGCDFRHLKNALRIRKGENITLCNGNGTDYLCEVTDILIDSVKVIILKSEQNKAEPAVKITLYQGLPKSDKMDLIIQKNVETGVAEIIPVITEYSVSRINNSRDEAKKIERWSKIAEEAAKQCGRGRIPLIGAPLYFSEALDASSGHNYRIMAYEDEKTTGISDILRDMDPSSGKNKIALYVGPEGGFSPREAKMASSKGILPVTLGPRILRTETAAIVANTVILSISGDI